MTEAEWLASKDPSRMIVLLEQRGCKNNRKFRLFAVGCCRQIWSGLEDPRSRLAVEIAEGFADGEATQSELREAFIAASAAVEDCRDFSPFSENQAIAAFLTAARNINESATKIPESEDAIEIAAHVWSYAVDSELSRPVKQEILLHDIFGNPFRHMTFDPSWRTDDTVGIATKMYYERNFDAMPILADALEDARCDNLDILNHCREPGVHVRGCWVVDLVLDKE
jgi:hypothetical protein